jgi:hypothetical protein
LHVKSVFAPSIELYFPAKHNVHWVLPVNWLNCPTGQSIQFQPIPVPGPYVPVGQLMHPAADVKPVPVEYFPTAQPIQEALEANADPVQYVPTLIKVHQPIAFALAYEL